MIPIPSGVQVWLATGHTDMRRGFDGLALLVQETLKRNPHSGHLFVFRGRRGSLVISWKRRPYSGCVGSMTCTSAGMGTSASAAGVFLNPFAGRDRLASAATHVASTSRRMTAAL